MEFGKPRGIIATVQTSHGNHLMTRWPVRGTIEAHIAQLPSNGLLVQDSLPAAGLRMPLYLTYV
jgi:hypothetical protein